MVKKLLATILCALSFGALAADNFNVLDNTSATISGNPRIDMRAPSVLGRQLIPQSGIIRKKIGAPAAEGSNGYDGAPSEFREDAARGRSGHASGRCSCPNPNS